MKHRYFDILVIFLTLLMILALVRINAATIVFAYDEEKPVVTEHKKDWSADFLWEELSKYSPNDKITAGIMGYFWRESSFRSDAIAGWPTFDMIQKCDSSREFTRIVDQGLSDGSSYCFFVNQISNVYGGYGLGQWLSPNYLEHYYGFVRERQGSIGDARLQCAFIFESLQRNDRLWCMLLEDKTAADVGRHIGTLYDGTSMSDVIASFADYFYKEYHK